MTRTRLLESLDSISALLKDLPDQLGDLAETTETVLNYVSSLKSLILSASSAPAEPNSRLAANEIFANATTTQNNLSRSQVITMETAQRILGEYLTARSVIQWLIDKELVTCSNADELAQQYATHNSAHRDFLQQFDLL